MGIIKTGIQAGVAYAAVNKVTKAMEASAAAKAQTQTQRALPPPHPPCNCPHCPFSQQSVYGNAPAPPPNVAYAPYAPPANASYYAHAGAPVPRGTDVVLERGGAGGAQDDKDGNGVA